MIKNIYLKLQNKSDHYSFQWILPRKSPIRGNHVPMYGTPSSVMYGYYRCFQMYSSWTKSHIELVCLEEIFLKNGYPGNQMEWCSSWCVQINPWWLSYAIFMSRGQSFSGDIMRFPQTLMSSIIVSSLNKRRNGATFSSGFPSSWISS